MLLLNNFYRYPQLLTFLVIAFSLVLAACAPPPATPSVSQVDPTSTPIATTAAVTKTSQPATGTPTPPPPSPTITHTPFPSATPAPVVDFQTKLAAGVSAAPYISDQCLVIQNRWSSSKSTPGTIVVPVMIHSIAKPGRPISDDTTISEEYFLRFIQTAHEMGYQTITSAQLVGFLQHNDPIPPLSLMLIVDDRKRAEYFDTYFVPYYQKYGFTVTNAWISHPDTPAYLWKENEPFAASGVVDFQAHGMIHNTPMDESASEAYIRGEIYGPIAAISSHFGRRPILLVWPRGLFTPQAVKIAAEAGYQAGFTATSRGPLLFNWIPLSEKERNSGSPLMVMPRYWSTAAIAALLEGEKIGKEAQSFYLEHKANDLTYYSQYCKGYPELN